MTAWCHLPTISNLRRALWITGLIALCAAFITTLLFAHVSHAAPSTAKVINFQGRLSYPTGGVVADGYYNIEFKIYQGGTGSTPGNGGITPSWTESYTNNNTNAGVYVKGGYFSVSLGSKTPFGSSVDWDNDTLWLSMNVAGNANNCLSFGGANCAADGEMVPMQRMTAVPYAINAGALGGKAAENFIQMAQGVQTDTSNNTSSIFINKTGTGNLMQLQNNQADVFTVSNAGDLAFGNSYDHDIYISQSEDDTVGRTLAVTAGNGGNGSGADGGDLRLQGGSAGGTNGNGGNVQIDAGQATGSGTAGYIAIGTTHASNILIGSTYLDIEQDIYVGANDTAGNNTNVTIGNGGASASGQTTIQAKDHVAIKTDGETRATFTNSNAVYFGNGVSASTPDDFTIQGTNSSASGTAGGSLSVQGGNATTGNANGGNLTLSGGSGSGTGTNGLVVMTTPTFSTVTNDTNCYTGGAAVAANCTISANTVNSASAVIVGFSTDGRVATLPAPANATAGRIMYVMAAGGSHPFTLRVNTGSAAEQSLTLRANMTATMIWNGSAWTAAGGSSMATLQDVYDTTLQSAGTAAVNVNNTDATNGLTIRGTNAAQTDGSLLAVQSPNSQNVFSINGSSLTEFASNGNAEAAGNTADAFPADTWGSAGTSTVSRHTTAGDYISTGNASVKVSPTGANSGTYNIINATLSTDTTYNVSLAVRLESGTLNDLGVYYTNDGNDAVACQNDIAVTTGKWLRITCSFQTPSSDIEDTSAILVTQSSAGSPVFYIDDLSVNLAATPRPNVQIGSGMGDGAATLFKLDRSATAPTAASSDALLGSMYYDTSLGKVQCYESTGWGACSARPDTFVSLSPEYANAVINTEGTGTFGTDICSNTLGINTSICSSNETYNLYKWTTDAGQNTTQTRSIYITYQLPDSFKEFVPNATSLMARTNSTDSSVKFHLFRNRSSTSLSPCGGSDITASDGVKSSWQKTAATSTNDPAQCNFKAGDSVLVRIDLSSKSAANAYVSTLNFAYTNK